MGGYPMLDEFNSLLLNLSKQSKFNFFIFFFFSNFFFYFFIFKNKKILFSPINNNMFFIKIFFQSDSKIIFLELEHQQFCLNCNGSNTKEEKFVILLKNKTKNVLKHSNLKRVDVLLSNL